MAARRPFWKWHRWKSIGFCLWPPSTCIWNFKLKFQSKLDLCSGNHVVYRQTDGQTDRRTDKVNPVYPPSNYVGRGYNKGVSQNCQTPNIIMICSYCVLDRPVFYWNQVPLHPELTPRWSFLCRWCPPKETSQPHPPLASRCKSFTHYLIMFARKNTLQ